MMYLWSCNVCQNSRYDLPAAQATHVTLEAMCASHDAPKKYSISCIRHAIRNFSESTQYVKIKSYAQKKRTLILHCHGFPGSGKSELTLKLAENFPFEDSANEPNLFVKWHIQCYGKKNEIRQRLTDLLREMRKNSLIDFHRESSLVNPNPSTNVACSLLKALCSSGVPILIVIDDILQKDQFLNDFLRCVDANCGNKEKKIKLHIYLTMRMKSHVLPDDECLAMDHYHMESITGFDKMDGINFLLEDDLENDEEISHATDIFERYSGSPLGLGVAKAYCKDLNMSYKDYVERLRRHIEGEVILTKLEIDFIKEEYGNKAQHIFQIMTMPFKLNSDSQSNEDAVLQWNVLSCLSYFHHDEIPKCIVKNCFHILRNGSTEKETNNRFNSERDYERFRMKLVNNGMCTSNNKNLYFHEVVLHAFRITQQEAEREKHLVNAVWTMAGLITKNVGTKKYLTKMHKLFRHVETLLKHVDKKPLTFLQPRQAYLVSIVISRLYEAAGAVALTLPFHVNLSVEYFKHSAEILWNKDEEFSLCKPSNEFSIDDVADRVVKNCELCGNVLPQGFITEYVTKVTRFDSLDLEFLEKHCNISDNFQKLKEIVTSNGNNDRIIEILRKCDIFLDEETHKKVFLAERLASILHSWSRAIIYKEIEETHLTVDQSLWLSSVAHAISQKCRERYNFSLIFERLSYITRKMYIAIERKDDLKALIEAKQLYQNMLDSGAEENSLTNAFCNGLLVEIYGISHPTKRNQILRYMVRVYGRLLKHHHGNLEAIEKIAAPGNVVAEELLSFASEHFHDISNAPISVIQCGKYFAANKNFDKAMACFEIYFHQMKSGSTIYQFHFWAIYNYARAVLQGNRLDKVGCATQYVENALGDIESLTHNNKMKQKLEDTQLRLRELKFQRDIL